MPQVLRRALRFRVSITVRLRVQGDICNRFMRDKKQAVWYWKCCLFFMALAYGSPLYGRRTAQIRMKQIPFRYYHEFCGDLPLKEQIDRYAATGGMPKYIESFADGADIFTGIADNILDLLEY